MTTQAEQVAAVGTTGPETPTGKFAANVVGGVRNFGENIFGGGFRGFVNPILKDFGLPRVGHASPMYTRETSGGANVDVHSGYLGTMEQHRAVFGGETGARSLWGISKAESAKMAGGGILDWALGQRGHTMQKRAEERVEGLGRIAGLAPLGDKPTADASTARANEITELRKETAGKLISDKWDSARFARIGVRGAAVAGTVAAADFLNPFSFGWND